jgi:hypothetical protein
METSLMVFQVTQCSETSLFRTFQTFMRFNAIMFVEVVVQTGLVKVELLTTLLSAGVPPSCAIVKLFQVFLQTEVPGVDFVTFGTGELVLTVLVLF